MFITYACGDLQKFRSARDRTRLHSWTDSNTGQVDCRVSDFGMASRSPAGLTVLLVRGKSVDACHRCESVTAGVSHADQSTGDEVSYPPIKVAMKTGHQIQYSLIMPFEPSGMSAHQLGGLVREERVRTKGSSVMVESSHRGRGLSRLERDTVLASRDWVLGRQL